MPQSDIKIENNVKTKSLIRSGFKALLCLLVIVVLLVLGLFIFIRSNSGLNFVLNKGKAALSNQGLTLSYQEAKGPLPFRLSLKDVSLKDQDGIFLEIDNLELRLKILKLLSLTVEAELLDIRGMDLKRSPVLKKSENKETQEPIKFPVSIIVNLNLQDSKVLSDLEASKLSLVNLNGQFSYLLDEGLLWDFNLSWEAPGDEGLKLSSILTKDSLALDLFAKFKKDGALEFIADKAQIPWEEPLLIVKAQGPLESFKGSLNLTDTHNQENSKESPDSASRENNTNEEPDSISGIFGTFELISEKGTSFHSLLKDPNLAKSLELSLKSSPGFPLPKGLESITGENLFANILMNRDADAFKGSVDLSSDRGLAHFNPLGLKFEEDKMALNLEGTFAFLVPSKDSSVGIDSGNTNIPGQDKKNPNAQNAQNAPNAPNAPSALSTQNAQNTQNTQSAQNSNLAKPQIVNASFDSTKSGSDNISAQNTVPSSTLSSDNEPLKALITLELISQNKRIELTKLNIVGDGLKLDLTGIYSGDLGLSDASLNLELKKGEAFTRLIPIYKTGINSDATISLKASYDQKSQTIEKGELIAHVSEVKELLSVFSGEASLNLDFSGPFRDRLTSKLSFKSPKITRSTKEGTVDFYDAGLMLNGDFESLLSAPAFKGDISLSAKDKFGEGLIKVSASPDVSYQENLLDASIGKLKVEGLGMEIDGDMALTHQRNNLPLILGDLNVLLKSFDDLRALSGIDLKGEPLSLNLSFTNPENIQNIAGKLTCKNLSLLQIKLSDTSLDFSAKSPFENPYVHLNLDTGPGEFSMFKWTKGTISISDLSKDNLAQVALSFLEGPNKELLSLKGSFNRTDGIVNLDSLKFSPPKLKEQLILQKPVKLTLNKGITSLEEERKMSLSTLTLSLGKAQIELSGDISPINARLAIKDLPYSAFSSITETSLPDGEIDLELDYKAGGNGKLSLDTNTTIKSENRPPLNIKLSSKGTIENGNKLIGDGILTLPGPAGRNPLDIKYQIPLKARGEFVSPDMAGLLSASLNWSGNISSLWGFLALPDRTLTGNTEINIDISGTLGKPEPKASVYLANSNYDDQILSLYLSGINLEAKVDPNGENIIVLLDAKDGSSGTIALEGTINLGKAPTLNARGQIKRLSPFHRDDFNVTLSALFSITGPLSQLKIGTKAVVEALELNLSTSIGGPSIATLNLDKGFQPKSTGPELDISIDIPRGAYIRGRGLDSEWKGNLQISGTTGAPILNGSLNPIRGYFTLMGKEFTFSGGGITFRNHRRLNPGLDIELHRNVSDLTAIVRVQGTLDTPKIRFESNPPYPQDEVLAQVLFGKPAAELSRFEAIQLANSLRELAGVGSNMPNPLATMRDALGLSVLRIGEASVDSDRHMQGNNFRQNLDLDDNDNSSNKDDTAPTIEAGKYITDNIYIGVDQNLVNNQTGVRVEIELSPSVNLVSRTSDTSSRVGVGWKHDY